MGPVSGRTKISITGEGFRPHDAIIVKFSSGKHEKEVSGLYISDTNLQCDTPSFDYPKKTDVFLKIGTGDFTIGSREFTYYLNTKAENTLAYGPGILSDNAVGYDTILIIQARNTINANRESGRDEFIVNIRRVDLKADEPPPHDTSQVVNQSQSSQKPADSSMVKDGEEE